jgi:hypothetical protein
MSKPTLIEKAITAAVRKPGKLELADLAQQIGIRTEDVQGHLLDLVNAGHLDVDPDLIPEATALYIRRVVSHGDVYSQPRLVEGGAISREDSGVDEIITWDGRIIRASVKAELGPIVDGEEGDGHTGRWLLNVAEIKGGEVIETLVEDQAFTDPEGSAIGGKALAWTWWDEYKTTLEPKGQAPEEPAEEPEKPWPNGNHRFRIDIDGRRFEAAALRMAGCDFLEFTEKGTGNFVHVHETSAKVRLYNDVHAMENFATELLRATLAKASEEVTA